MAVSQKNREIETCNFFFRKTSRFFFTCKTKFNYILNLSRAQEAYVLQEKSLSISSPRSESNFPKQLMGLQAEMKALALLHELESLSLSESSKCGANWQMLLLLSFFFVKPFPVLTFDLRKSADKKEGHTSWRKYWKTRVKVIFALFQLSDFISQFLHIFFAYLGKSKEISFFPPDGVWLIFCKISSKCTKWIWLDLASSLLRSDISQPQSLSGLEGWYLKTKLFNFLGLVNFRFF